MAPPVESDEEEEEEEKEEEGPSEDDVLDSRGVPGWDKVDALAKAPGADWSVRVQCTGQGDPEAVPGLVRRTSWLD